MNFLQLLQTIGISILASAVVVGVAVLVIRSWVDNLFSRDLEKFKADLQKERETHAMQLKARYDQQLELLRKQLEQTALEHQVRFTKLHEKRAEVIAELYKRLVQAERSINSLIDNLSLIKDLQSGQKELILEEDEKTARESGQQFSDYFDENQVYLDERLCIQIEKFNFGLKKIYISFLRDKIRGREGDQGETQEPEVDWGALKKNIPPIRTEIEQQFRKMLGVS